MYKKLICMVLCLVFLLSISYVVANDGFESDECIQTNLTFESEDIVFFDEYDSIGYDEENIYGNRDYYEFNESFESEQQLELNTTGVVMSDDKYSCGAASFATVLNNFGVNITLDEARYVVNTTVNGTTMEGIINGANKYNLTACGVKAEMEYLNENYIVHMSINGTEHWSVIKQITDNFIILSDPNMGNINYTKEDFSSVYTNNSIIISKSIDNLNVSHLILISNIDQKMISGKASNIYKRGKAYLQFKVVKRKLYWRWVYPTYVYKSYDYHKPWKYYLLTIRYKYSNWSSNYKNFKK